MKKLLGLVLVLAALSAAGARTVRAFSLPPEAQDALENAVREAHIPALAVAIVDPDGIVYSRTFGEDVSLDTPFLLGSLSKSFTALCILQLEEQGRLSLDDAVQDYLPEISGGISIRQLLNQTGGFSTYQVPGSTAPQSEAGSHIYANLNYALLGKIVESVSGQTYEDYLREHVLAPLGMNRTGASEESAHENGLVQGYENWFGFPVAAAARFPGEEDWIQPAAGYISASARDMAGYLEMYLHGGEGILAPGVIQRMFSESVHVEDDIPYEYGFGWTIVRESLPQVVYRHSGLVETGMTCMYLLPEEELGIILLADMNDYLVGTDLMDRVGWNLVLSILGEQPGVIGKGEYWLRHGLYDLLYAAVLTGAAAPLFLLPRFHRRLASGGRSRPGTAPVFLMLAAFLLCIPLLLGTPLWVVSAFVPDLHLVLWLASGMLFAAGCTRLWMIAAKWGDAY